jgi:hypothetical protein
MLLEYCYWLLIIVHLWISATKTNGREKQGKSCGTYGQIFVLFQAWKNSEIFLTFLQERYLFSWQMVAESKDYNVVY